MLIERIITAAIFGILAILSIFYLPIAMFKSIALLVVAIAVWEFSNFFWKNDYRKKVNFLILFLIISIISIKFFAPKVILLLGVLWWVAAPYFLSNYALHKHYNFSNSNIMLQSFLGIVIFVPCFVGLVEIREKFGPAYLIWFIAIVCAVDIGGYFTGKYFGKHKLAQQISPKKTVEGLLGGMTLALLIAIISGQGKSYIFFLLVLITCLWSVIGDLFESMLKRQSNVKDSGTILPGHGGMYDRIDSLTAAIPIFALGIMLLKG